jgi:hypothetical protein
MITPTLSWASDSGSEYSSSRVSIRCSTEVYEVAARIRPAGSEGSISGTGRASTSSDPVRVVSRAWPSTRKSVGSTVNSVPNVDRCGENTEENAGCGTPVRSARTSRRTPMS